MVDYIICKIWLNEFNEGRHFEGGFDSLTLSMCATIQNPNIYNKIGDYLGIS